MSLQAKTISQTQVWMANLFIAVSCGGIAVAACVLPNLERGDYLKKWSFPLALVCFAPPVLAVTASRWAIGRTVDYNEGYNQAIADQQGGANVQYQQQQSTQPFLLDSPAMAAAPAMGASDFGVRTVQAVHSVPADRDEFDFFNARTD